MEQKQPKHLEVGQTGEDLAVTHLRSKGFKIIERNYRKPYGEIDIVAKNDSVLHFVEVKTLSEDVTRDTLPDFRPEEHMNFGKRQRQKRVITTYLAERRVGDETDWQIDLVCVYLDGIGELAKIDVFEDIILA